MFLEGVTLASVTTMGVEEGKEASRYR